MLRESCTGPSPLWMHLDGRIVKPYESSMENLQQENERLRAELARLQVAFHETDRCPRCAMTEMRCADVIAELEVQRKAPAKQKLNGR